MYGLASLEVRLVGPLFAFAVCLHGLISTVHSARKTHGVGKVSAGKGISLPNFFLFSYLFNCLGAGKYGDGMGACACVNLRPVEDTWVSSDDQDTFPLSCCFPRLAYG